MRLILLLLLFSLAYAQPAPPVDNVSEHNLLIASALSDHYNSSTAQNSTIRLRFGDYTKDLTVSASVDVAGLSLLLDNVTYPRADLAVIMARGHQLEHIIAKPSEGYLDFECNRYFYEHITDETAWRCDFEPDYCVEYENMVYVLYDLNATFIFGNMTSTVPAPSTTVAVPATILDEMKDSSGSDLLNLSIDGSVTFIYEIDDKSFGYGDCGSHYYNISTSVPISINRSFRVAGANKLFFLRSPVLGEQWFRNNQFNMIVLSQSPLYSAALYLNDNLSSSMAIRTFEIHTNQYGLQEIFSNKTNASGWSESTNLTTPTLLDPDNHSFSYIYEFNYSYAGLGENNLSLVVNDSFLSSSRYDASILSRMLSYNGTLTEKGTPIDDDSRKSAGFALEELTALHLSLGLMAFIILLSLVNFWLKR